MACIVMLLANDSLSVASISSMANLHLLQAAEIYEIPLEGGH